MEELSSMKKKKARRVRTSEDLNQLNIQFVASTSSRLTRSEKKILKANKNSSHLNNLDWKIDKNCIPIISEETKLTKIKRNKKKNYLGHGDFEYINTPEVIKQEKKRKKEPTCGDDYNEGNESNTFNKKYTLKINSPNENVKTDVIKNDRNLGTKYLDSTVRKSDQKRKSILKSKIRNDASIQSPIQDENLCDIDQEHVKMNTKSEKRNTYELQNATFDISDLPVVNNEDGEIITKRKSIKNNLHKLKSTSFSDKMLKDSNILIDNKSLSILKDEKSLRRSNSLYESSLTKKSSNTRKTPSVIRKSVRFSSYDNSSIYEENSKNFPKSPHVKKLSKNSTKKSERVDDNSLIEISSTNSISCIELDSTNPSFSEINPSTPQQKRLSTRKRWNKSLDGSMLDRSKVLDNTSPIWVKTFSNNSMSFKRGSSSEETLSPILNSPEKNKKSMTSVNIKNDLQNLGSPIAEKMLLSSTSNNGGASEKVVSKIKFNTSLKNVDDIFSPSPKLKAITAKMDTSIKNKTENKSTVKKTKMPNFALIHQRAFDKLENLQEMSARKAERAELLLAGKKPGTESSNKNNVSSSKTKVISKKIKSPKTKKQLRYSLKRASLEKVNEPSKKSSQTANTEKQIVPSSSSNPQMTKTKVLNGKFKLIIAKPVKKPVENKENQKKLTKLGFKPNQNGAKVSKQDQIKAVANKTTIQRNSLEARRNVVQKVRTNRRFELLMKMRDAKVKK